MPVSIVSRSAILVTFLVCFMACAVQFCLASCAKFDSSKTNLPAGSAGPFHIKDFPYHTKLGNTNVVLGINYVNTKEFTIDFHLMNTDGQGCFAEVRRAGNLAPLTSAWKVMAHNDCQAIDDRRIGDSFDQGMVLIVGCGNI